MQYYSNCKQNSFMNENVLQQDVRYANNSERIVVKEDILTRLYFDETGNVEYHQILLLHQSFHETAHRHPDISKMLQEIRQKYYYPSMAKHVKRGLEGCK